MTYSLKSIGKVSVSEEKTTIQITEKYRKAMLHLDEFSHLIVLWWIEGRDTEEGREILLVTPPKQENAPLTGVFSCRSPNRPNPIGLTIVRVIEVNEEKGTIEIEKIDAYDQTPIIDIKPYLPKSDCIINAKIPEWFESLAKPKEELDN